MMLNSATRMTAAKTAGESSGNSCESGDGKRIAVLLLLTSTAGGVGVHAYYLAKFLCRSEFDLTVGYGPGYPMDREFERLDVPIVHFCISRKISPAKNLRALVQLYRFVKRRRFDIICMECSIAGFLGRITGWVTGVENRVFVLQQYASHSRQARIKQSIYRMIERRLDRLTTRYVAVSEAMKRFGVDHDIMRPEKVEVIYNGITLSDKVAVNRDEVRRDLGLSPDGPVIGTLARLEPQKGLQHFLQAAAIVRRTESNVEFLIAGDGPLMGELVKLAQQLGIADAVRFVGWRQDVVHVLSGIDIFCLPSLWESFGIAFAEAMAMEKPVVATRVDGVPEVVADGKTGLLVPPANPQAIASALLALLRDPDRAARMGKEGRRRVEAMFTVETMVARYEDLFRRLAKPSGKAFGRRTMIGGSRRRHDIGRR